MSEEVKDPKKPLTRLEYTELARSIMVDEIKKIAEKEKDSLIGSIVVVTRELAALSWEIKEIKQALNSIKTSEERFLEQAQQLQSRITEFAKRPEGYCAPSSMPNTGFEV